jgi:hypothetical protein
MGAFSMRTVLPCLLAGCSQPGANADDTVGTVSTSADTQGASDVSASMSGGSSAADGTHGSTTTGTSADSLGDSASDSTGGDPSDTAACETIAQAQCDVMAATAEEVRTRALEAQPGQTVCVAAGDLGNIDLKDVLHDDYVTVRGAPDLGTTLSGIEVDGSAYLRVHGFHFVGGGVQANRETVTHHIAISCNEIGPVEGGLDLCLS